MVESLGSVFGGVGQLVREAHGGIFVDSEGMIRKDFHSADVGHRAELAAKFVDVFVGVRDAGHEDIAEPYVLAFCGQSAGIFKGVLV